MKRLCDKLIKQPTIKNAVHSKLLVVRVIQKFSSSMENEVEFPIYD